MFEKDNPAEREKIFKAYEDADNRNLLPEKFHMFWCITCKPDVIDNIDEMVEGPLRRRSRQARTLGVPCAVALDRMRMVPRLSPLIPGKAW